VRSTPTLALLLLASVAAGCGPGDSYAEGTVVGTYVLDVDRTPAVAATGGDDASRQADEARRARLRAKFGPDAYRIEVLADGTFRTTVAQPDAPFTFSGTWTRTGDGLRLVTTEVDGSAPPADAATVETAAVEPGALVLTEGGRTVYLRRL
jgi:hypothetical protein